MSHQSLDGKLVRWYKYSHDGRIKDAGHGIVLKQVDYVFHKDNDDLNTYEILINGAIKIFAKKDFQIVEQETSDDKSKEK